MKNKIKLSIENYRDAFPEIINTVGDYLKTVVSKENLEVLSTSTGTIATLVKIFSKPIVNKIYDSIDFKQLKDFGLETYLKTAISFSNACLQKLLINESISSLESIKRAFDQNTILDIITEQIHEISIRPALIFQPKYHPVVILVKNIYKRILLDNFIDSEVVNAYLKEFNTGISIEIEKEFGDNYVQHLKAVNAAHLNERESELLNDIVCNSKIGFSFNEHIDYVESFGQWKSISTFEAPDYVRDNDALLKKEASLVNLKTLIQQYFSVENSKNIEKMLFIIADFGKGKSVFLKQFAAELALNYLNNSDGYFPIYFNLRDYVNYQSDARLGVVYDYLETRYGIKLEDEYFKSKKFIFLIDSLDESGDLSKINIDKVLNSVKRIQNLDKVKCRENRIIITSRPFDDGLKNHLIANSYLKSEEKEKSTNTYLSLYGFKIDQFNSWIGSLLKNNKKFMNESKSPLCKEIIQELKDTDVYNLHFRLNKEANLSYEELKRPIFSYMIYQLLINDYDFLKVGKIGVYLSFINLLSKEAKYIHDEEYSFNLMEQFECRNILHSISSLWAHERITGSQGYLKKADVCRAVEANIIDENDERVLEKFRGKNINEISFLSHSYFGENDNVLHFQHQSFAEILLAEYYLKVIIKHSLDRTVDLNKVRLKLFVGQPSSQTIDFLKGLIMIFKEASSKEISDEIIEKRKLLFPFISSIALEKYNKELASENLFYNWFSKVEWDESINEFPDRLLQDWFFDSERVEKMAELCKAIIEDDTYEFLLSKSSRETSIFKEELTKIKSTDLGVQKIDTFLCLFIGNILINSEVERVFFFHRFDSETTIRILRKLLSIEISKSALWKQECFKGLRIRSSFLYFNFSPDLSFINFSYSDIYNVSFSGCNLLACNFSNSTFTNVDFSSTDISYTIFKDCKFEGVCHFELAIIYQGVFFPYNLARVIFERTEVKPSDEILAIEFYGIHTNYGPDKLEINEETYSRYQDIFKNVKIIVKYLYEERKIIKRKDILDSFDISRLPLTLAKKAKLDLLTFLELKKIK